MSADDHHDSTVLDQMFEKSSDFVPSTFVDSWLIDSWHLYVWGQLPQPADRKPLYLTERFTAFEP